MFSGLFQPMHLIVILVIVMIIFGPGKLPELGSSLGKAIKDFKRSVGSEAEEGVDKAASANEIQDGKR